jgi:diguanylate cyclase (GGDEF)-like protein/PAS domain S-box-containing protein
VSLSALLLPPSLEAQQALRLRRFGAALWTYVFATAMTAIAWAFGVLPLSTVAETVAAFAAVNLGLYLVIRSGLNLRFADPSLTQQQMLAAITILMYIVYHMDDGREVALFACFIVFLFGIFRLTTRQSSRLTLYTLAAYALVINLLMHWRPQAIGDVHGEWMSWLGLAGFLPCCTLLGAQISAMRRRMRASESRFRILTEMSADFYWETDAEHRLADRNLVRKKAGALSMFRRGVAMGERRWEIDSLSPDEAGWRVHRAALDAHQPFRGFEHSRRGLDGLERHISISGDPVFDASGAFTGYQGIGTEITERKRSEELLRESALQLRAFADDIQRVAHHDSLTGLPNRLLFDDRLAQSIKLANRNGLEFALLYLDLDRFKPVNDALGHAAGDELLKAVAARISSQVREADTVARVGGDEFTVILLDVAGREEARRVGAKIAAAIGAPFAIGSSRQAVEIGTSIGIALYPQDAASAKDLVMAADADMYSAKQSGAPLSLHAA